MKAATPMNEQALQARGLGPFEQAAVAARRPVPKRVKARAEA